MLPYNVSFPVCQPVFFRRISQCNPWMIKSVQLMWILIIGNVPVVQKIVMQQCPSDHFSPAAGDMQVLAQGYTVSRHIQHVGIHCHIAMLNILLHTTEIL